jgi:flagellin-like hook-associated protein FlgL
MQLLRGQMVNQLMLGQIGGISLNEYMLGNSPPARSGREIMNDALSGLMRSDAAMLHQASKNMGEGEVISKQAGEAVKSLRENIALMYDLAVKYSSASTDEKLVLRSEYGDLAAQVKATVENTGYNGIKLLDGNAWAGDERIQSAGGTGKLTLQAGRSPTEMTLFNLDAYTKFNAEDDLDGDALTGTIGKLDAAKNFLGTLHESFEAKAGLYASEAASYARQADILDEATGKAAPGDEQSLKDALLNILLREQGIVLNRQS